MNKPERGKPFIRIGTCYSMPDEILNHLIRLVWTCCRVNLKKGCEDKWYTLWIDDDEHNRENQLRVRDIVSGFTSMYRLHQGVAESRWINRKSGDVSWSRG